MLAICGTPLNARADRLKLLHRLRRLDENAVGAGLEILLAAAERLVEAVHGAGIGARDDEEVLVPPRADRGLDLRHHVCCRDHVLAGHVAAALGRDLVLQENRGRAHRLVALDGVGDVLDVAVAGVAVDQHRQRASPP